MDMEKIKALLELTDSREFTEFEVEDGVFKFKIKRGSPEISAAANYSIPAKKAEVSAAESGNGGAVSSGMNEAVSPVAGVFYAAAAPGAEPFVKVGDRVKKGDVLCIVEAMKTMNEILCEFDGEITECCVQNEEFVEFGQILYRIK